MVSGLLSPTTMNLPYGTAESDYTRSQQRLARPFLFSLAAVAFLGAALVFMLGNPIQSAGLMSVATRVSGATATSATARPGSLKPTASVPHVRTWASNTQGSIQETALPKNVERISVPKASNYGANVPTYFEDSLTATEATAVKELSPWKFGTLVLPLVFGALLGVAWVQRQRADYRPVFAAFAIDGEQPRGNEFSGRSSTTSPQRTRPVRVTDSPEGVTIDVESKDKPISQPPPVNQPVGAASVMENFGRSATAQTVAQVVTQAVSAGSSRVEAPDVEKTFVIKDDSRKGLAPGASSGDNYREAWVQRFAAFAIDGSLPAPAGATSGDYPKPPKINDTDNYREAEALSAKFASLNGKGKSKKVAIIGGGLAGLACARYLVDAGHEPVIYEARDVLGGKVSAWKDEDGDWIETGLHIFFGAYPNIMNLFKELDIEDRLQWKIHQMIFAMQELPGEFTTFDFPAGVPAPFNFIAAILSNQKMLSLPEKIQTAPALAPMLIRGQDFIDEQDELSVLEFMRAYGMPDKINEEVFISMAKALDFIDPDKLSMTVVLTAMNRFLNETDGLQMAFLDGNQPDRLCAPMMEYVKARGGDVKMSSPMKQIVLNEDGSVKHLEMRNGDIVEADEYISAMPCDIMKRLMPKDWGSMPYFHQIEELEGIPVINIHLWFDRKLNSANHLTFSRSPLLSVYADMSTTCKEYYDPDKSMLELVFAPCSPLAGGNTNWIAKSNEEIVEATMKELERLFPTEIGPGSPDGVGAQLIKSAVVKVPRSVYAAIPGRNKYRPSQETPISNFTLAGDWTSQKFLGSMEGAVLSGKLAAEVVADRAAGNKTKGVKMVQEDVIGSARTWKPRDPRPQFGDGATVFGAGAVLTPASEKQLKEDDPAQFA